MNIILNFAFGLFSVLLLAAIAKWIADKCTSAESARVASFVFVLGDEMGKGRSIVIVNWNLSPSDAHAFGALVGVVIVWFVLFGREHFLLPRYRS